VKDTVEIGHHIVIGHAQHLKPMLAQHIVAQPILCLVMRVAIDLDDQRPLRAEEVGDKAINDGLAAKLVTFQLAIG